MTIIALNIDLSAAYPAMCSDAPLQAKLGRETQEIQGLFLTSRGKHCHPGSNQC